jgi:hypothetical protein
MHAPHYRIANIVCADVVILAVQFHSTLAVAILAVIAGCA